MPDWRDSLVRTGCGQFVSRKHVWGHPRTGHSLESREIESRQGGARLEAACTFGFVGYSNGEAKPVGFVSLACCLNRENVGFLFDGGTKYLSRTTALQLLCQVRGFRRSREPWTPILLSERLSFWRRSPSGLLSKRGDECPICGRVASPWAVRASPHQHGYTVH